MWISPCKLCEMKFGSSVQCRLGQGRNFIQPTLSKIELRRLLCILSGLGLLVEIAIKESKFTDS